MSKPMFRLHFRACDLEQPVIALDVTRKDFHSGSLELYVTEWFNDVENFIDYLCTSKHDSIILIVSSLLADIAIYAFCPLFPQISKVYILGESLRNDDLDRHANLRYFDADSLLHILVYNIKANILTHQCYANERSTNDLTTNSAKYVWYQFFFDIISNLNHTNIARHELVDAVCVFHPPENKNDVQRNCKEFEQTYRPNDIIEWYTRTCFFYVPLNRALRSENVNQMFTFRYIISDLKQRIEELQINHSIPTHQLVYRGQQMYPEELKSIADKVGNPIGTTTFWSATYRFDLAYHTAMSPMRPIETSEPVIFTVSISSNHYRSTFTDISRLSSYKRTQQLIFPPHTLFRVKNVIKPENIWCIHLTVIDESDDQFIHNVHLWKTTIGLRNFFSMSVGEEHKFLHNISKEGVAFLKFQLLMDIILRLDHNQFARDEMLELCRARFPTDKSQLTQIDTFDKTYVSEHAITWYTKDCFLYRSLNESLRNEDTNTIIKLRYFIYDLHNQLAELHLDFLRSLPLNQPILKLYRGLKMTISELEIFRENETNFVSMNSFLSTTRDYQAARLFAGDGKVEDPEVSVIYEIDVDIRVPHSVPFAEIEYKSYFTGEDEVLFSMAAIFRIGKTQKKEDRLWQIALTLTPLAEEHWNVLTAHLKK